MLMYKLSARIRLTELNYSIMRMLRKGERIDKLKGITYGGRKYSVTKGLINKKK
jgi:hypothetical protein